MTTRDVPERSGDSAASGLTPSHRSNKARVRACDRGKGQRRRACWRGTEAQFTVMLAGWEGIPFATTSSLLAPVSMPEGTSKLVETDALPVATPIVLWSCVRA